MMNWRQVFHSQTGFALVFLVLFIFLMRPVEFNKSKDLTDTGYEVTPRFFKFITSGQWPAAVDYLWIQTIQSIADKSFSADQISEIAKVYRLCQSLDPIFFENYEQGAIAFIGLIKEASGADEILTRAIRVHESGQVPKGLWPKVAMLYIYRAYVTGYMKNDFVRARLDFIKASEMPGAPAYLIPMKKHLLEEGNEKGLAVRMLKVLISNTQDPEMKALYEEKLKAYE